MAMSVMVIIGLFVGLSWCFSDSTNEPRLSGHRTTFFLCPLARIPFVVGLNADINHPRKNRPMENTATPYMLFFRNSGPETHQHLSPAQRQELMMRWNAWYDELAATGQAVEGQPLELETRLVSGRGGERVTDGPFAEAKEAIGGYVKLFAQSLEEATAIAQRHPGLEHGLIIEVRQLTENCHLGVQRHAAATVAER